MESDACTSNIQVTLDPIGSATYAVDWNHSNIGVSNVLKVFVFR